MATLRLVLEGFTVGWAGYSFAHGTASDFGYELPQYPDPVPTFNGAPVDWRISSEPTDSWQIQKELLMDSGFRLSSDGREIQPGNFLEKGRRPDSLGVTSERFARLAESFEDRGSPVGDFRIWDDRKTKSASLSFYIPSDAALWAMLAVSAVQKCKLELLSFGHHYAKVEGVPAPTVEGFMHGNQALFLNAMPFIRMID